MKSYFKYFITSSVAILITVALLLLLIMDTHAQGNKPKMQWAPAVVNIDGVTKEWGDTLTFYDAKTKLHYTVGNDDSMLYVAIFTADRQAKRKIMAGGITVSVDPKGKKHKTYSLTYPLMDKGAIFARHDNDAADKDGNDNAAPQAPPLLQSTSIKVAGFKHVESDVITTSNTYGFKAAIKLDDQHNLGYELAIPLKFLDLKKGKIPQMAVNIAVNGVERPSQMQGRRGEGGGTEGIGGSGNMGGSGFGGGRMGGMGGMGSGGFGGGMGGGRGMRGARGSDSGNQADKAGLSQSEDFWVKFSMAAK